MRNIQTISSFFVLFCLKLSYACQSSLPEIHFTILPLTLSHVSKQNIIVDFNWRHSYINSELCNKIQITSGKRTKDENKSILLSNKNSMLRSDMMSLKQKQKYNSTTNDITRETLGAKLQQEGLHFGLAEEEEHPWLGGQLHGPRPLQPFPLWHPLISQRVFSLCPCLCPSPPWLPVLGRWLG